MNLLGTELTDNEMKALKSMELSCNYSDDEVDWYTFQMNNREGKKYSGVMSSLRKKSIFKPYENEKGVGLVKKEYADAMFAS